MNEFFKSEDLVPISQKKVSILAQNGLNYAAGQRIDFEVPAGVGFINPKQCYLSVTCKIELPAGVSPALLCLDSRLGGQSLIRDIRIFSGNDEILEEIQDYNILQGVRFDFSSNETLKQKRGLTEGCTVASVKNRGTKGTTISEYNNVTSNSWFSKDTSTPQTTAFNNASFNEVKMLLPLYTGIFSPDSKIFPVQLTQGLKISIILADPGTVLRQMDNTVFNRRVRLNPIFHSMNGSSTVVGRTKFVPGSASDTFYVEYSNNNINCENFPFVVGQRFKFIDQKTMKASTTQITSESFRHANNANVGAAGDFIIKEIQFANPADNSINDGNGLIQITLDIVSDVSGGEVLPGDFAMFSTSVESASNTSYDATYNLSKVEFIVESVEMPPQYTSQVESMMSSGGSMIYDFLSFTNYKYSQQITDRVANIRLPLLNSRCKSALFCPCDATIRTTQQMLASSDTYIESIETDDILVRQNSPGLRPIYDFISEYQIFYDGKLNPNRKIQCGLISDKISIEQQPLIELEKALHMAKIDVLSFADFRSNGCIGRALSLQDGVVDARGKSIDLQAEYRQTNAPQFPKLWSNFIAHVRRLTINQNGITVEV
tara:strand:- start:3893 stop:5698 length:1806 start_codon:yes stop_codon:yes gene_type:complete